MAVKKPQRGLGRGLGALLGEDVVAEEKRADEVFSLPIRLIDPNRNQPRRTFDEAALKELAQSIRAVGVLQPIIVSPAGERYAIVAGERRYRASRMAGLEEIPAIVRDWDAQARLEAALVENLQRDDLNPIEEAMGVRMLMDEAGMTQERAAERLGKSRSALANLLRLLNLPESVRQLILANKLTAGHARALVALEDSSRQEKLAQLCVAQGWSVRQFEKICQAAMKAEPRPILKAARDPQLKELESLIRNALGLRAKLEGDLNAGKITLTYYSQDDLQRVWDALSRLN